MTRIHTRDDHSDIICLTDHQSWPCNYLPGIARSRQYCNGSGKQSTHLMPYIIRQLVWLTYFTNDSSVCRIHTIYQTTPSDAIYVELAKDFSSCHPITPGLQNVALLPPHASFLKLACNFRIPNSTIRFEILKRTFWI
jgi:hypothetical protein